jgi:hypothetical protein
VEKQQNIFIFCKWLFYIYEKNRHFLKTFLAMAILPQQKIILLSVFTFSRPLHHLPTFEVSYGVLGQKNF